jgi:hypothetical protein
MEAPMTSGTPPVATNNPQDDYRRRVVEILDDWKAGRISQTEAHQNHDDAVAVLIGHLYNDFRVRLNVLEAWCHPRPVSQHQQRWQ